MGHVQLAVSNKLRLELELPPLKEPKVSEQQKKQL